MLYGCDNSAFTATQQTSASEMVGDYNKIGHVTWRTAFAFCYNHRQ